MATQTTLDFPTLIEDMVKAFDLVVSTPWPLFANWLHSEVAGTDPRPVERADDWWIMVKRFEVIPPGELPLHWPNTVALWLGHMIQSICGETVDRLDIGPIMALEVRELGAAIQVIGYCLFHREHRDYMADLAGRITKNFPVKDNQPDKADSGFPRLVAGMTNTLDLFIPTDRTRFVNWLDSELLKMKSVTTVKPNHAAAISEKAWDMPSSNAFFEIVFSPRNFEVIQPGDPPLLRPHLVVLWRGQRYSNRYGKFVDHQRLGPLVALEVIELERGIQVAGYCFRYREHLDYMADLAGRITKAFPAAQDNRPTQEGKGRKRDGGPTARTRIRAQVFKKLKGAHPEWSQAKVAIEAQEELGEVCTADTVRNAYRAMDWEWQRADRIR